MAYAFIKDSGAGMSKETLGKIFEKFNRAKDASKFNTEGSGLGLYVAKAPSTFRLLRKCGVKIYRQAQRPSLGGERGRRQRLNIFCGATEGVGGINYIMENKFELKENCTEIKESNEKENSLDTISNMYHVDILC